MFVLFSQFISNLFVTIIFHKTSLPSGEGWGHYFFVIRFVMVFAKWQKHTPKLGCFISIIRGLKPTAINIEPLQGSFTLGEILLLTPLFYVSVYGNVEKHKYLRRSAKSAGHIFKTLPSPSSQLSLYTAFQKQISPPFRQRSF